MYVSLPSHVKHSPITYSAREGSGDLLPGYLNLGLGLNFTFNPLQPSLKHFVFVMKLNYIRPDLHKSKAIIINHKSKFKG